MSARRRTIVLEGPLAHRMARLAAARTGETGLQLMSFTTLAARLAGGFARPAEATDLDAAIRSALDEGGFTDFESIRVLPGMTRASASTLARIWNGDLDAGSVEFSGNGRMSDLAMLERRVRTRLPTGALTPRDLRDAAMARLSHATSVLGPIVLERVGVVDPVWRPLVAALCGVVAVEWHNPGSADTAWFPGTVIRASGQHAANPGLVTCANPRAEVVESLRWARELITTGRAKPEEVAICATSPAEWDEHFVALSGDASVPVHFSHGLPAVASWDGQYCAALADVMLNGLNQDRVRRLLGYAQGRSPALKDLPKDWARGLKASASLLELEHWRLTLAEASRFRTDGADPGALLLPVLEKLAVGPEAAEELGAKLLPTATRNLWSEALRRAPATAVDLSLAELRVPDGRDAGVRVAWCPAGHLAAAPRRWVRLLGMTARSWPRASPDDPLLPDHILPRKRLILDSLTEQDRRAFALITAHAEGGCVLSRSRRNAQGGLVASSPLLDHAAPVAGLKLTRVPSHAFSEADRLLARPAEALATARFAGALGCWRGLRRRDVVPHDGGCRIDHPLIDAALEQVQSATSLRRMLRDPIAFVWRYALGWRASMEEQQPLSLDAKAYGELVHALLKSTVDSLEASTGFTRAPHESIEAALEAAKATVSSQWPLERSVPPLLLWRHTIESAGHLALRALTHDELMPATKSWTEVAFGGDAQTSPAPWNTSLEVQIPGTTVRIRGAIDRLDLREKGDAVRVSDYKTGTSPRAAASLVLDGGKELQRVVYAIAARQLLPGPPKVIARLLYLGTDTPVEVKLPDVDEAISQTTSFVSDAMGLLRQGVFLPAGPDVVEDWNEYRLMLPSWSTYLDYKRPAFDRAYDVLRRRWRQM